MKKETVIIFTKYLLDFMYFAGIVVTVLLPFPGLLQRLMDLFDFHDFEGRYMEIIVIYFVLGILAVLILGELRKMFRTVLNDDCFVKDNVVSLQRMGTYSFVIAVICLLRTVLYMTIAMLVLVLVFIIAGLFSKVLASCSTGQWSISWKMTLRSEEQVLWKLIERRGNNGDNNQS